MFVAGGLKFRGTDADAAAKEQVHLRRRRSCHPSAATGLATSACSATRAPATATVTAVKYSTLNSSHHHHYHHQSLRQHPTSSTSGCPRPSSLALYRHNRRLLTLLDCYCLTTNHPNTPSPARASKSANSRFRLFSNQPEEHCTILCLRDRKGLLSPAIYLSHSTSISSFVTRSHHVPQ